MDSCEKKQLKDQAKIGKKREKAQLKARKKAEKLQTRRPPEQSHQNQPAEVEASAAVKFAETVRGILYLILSVSMAIAVLLSNQGYIMTLEDIFQSSILARLGKLILIVIAIALFIYGLKKLRAVK